MATSSPIQERSPFQSGFRRSFAPPPRSLSYHERAGLDPSDSAAEILYSHPSARIIKFSPPYNATRSVSTPIPQDLDYPVDTVETLPWASTTETTVASGLLIIEKVQGSTNFLKSGTVMHAILRNSQCWCVDGESTFVLRIGKFQYYRIKLPTNSDDDRAKVEELKMLLKKILRFERTPCPFKRGFHVDLPESDITPRRKGTWKRRQSLQVSTSVGGTPSSLSRERSSRTEAMQAGNGFGKDGQEDESFTNSSEFDEDEVHSESDDHEDHNSHLPVTPISEPTVDHSDNAEVEDGQKLQTEENETAENESNNGQEISDEPAIPLEQAEMVLGEPHPCKSPPSQQEIERIPGVETLELEVDATETKSFTVETSPEPDTVMETASQPTTDPSEHTPGKLSPLDAVAADPDLGVEIASQPTTDPPEPTPPELSRSDAVATEPDLGVETASQPTTDLPEPTPELCPSDAVATELDRAVEPASQPTTDLPEPTPPELCPSDAVATELDRAVEPASQPPMDLPEPTPGELPPSGAIAPETTLAEIDDEELQIQELGENGADNADGLIEEQGESRPLDTLSIASSSYSFHSLEAPESSTSPTALSPPDSPPSPTPRAELLDPLAMQSHHAHKRDLSELMITPSSPGLELLSHLATASPERPSSSASDWPTTPQLARSSASDGSWTEVETPSGLTPTSQIQHRLKARRSLSPLPPSPTLYTPSPQQDRSNHLTSAILQKACSLALGKPIEVVVMLIHILARIAGGATVNDLINGNLFKRPGQEREHQRNRSLPDQIDGKGDPDLDEDDFGVPIRGRSRSSDIVKADDETDSLFELD